MEAQAGAGGNQARTLFGHPPGLTVVCTTQMWAKFSFFGLQALLVYYMTKQLGFAQPKSSLIYGAYDAAAFFSPFFGELIADRWLGRTASVIAGGGGLDDDGRPFRDGVRDYPQSVSLVLTPDRRKVRLLMGFEVIIRRP